MKRNIGPKYLIHSCDFEYCSHASRKKIVSLSQELSCEPKTHKTIYRLDISTWASRYLTGISNSQEQNWTFDLLNLSKWHLYSSSCLCQKCGNHPWHCYFPQPWHHIPDHDPMIIPVLPPEGSGFAAVTNNSIILVAEDHSESARALPDSAELISGCRSSSNLQHVSPHSKTRMMGQHHHYWAGACHSHGKWQEHKRLVDTYKSS